MFGLDRMPDARSTTDAEAGIGLNAGEIDAQQVSTGPSRVAITLGAEPIACCHDDRITPSFRRSCLNQAENETDISKHSGGCPADRLESTAGATRASLMLTS
jgi:hypothetical protein